MLNAIAKYLDHPSIIKIKNTFAGNSFEFTKTDTETVHELVMSLNSKNSTSGEISSKILQKSADICSFALKDCFNSCLDKTFFPDSLKRATITPVFKEGDPTNVINYRPISILPTVSKVFENIIAQQLNPFLETASQNYCVAFGKDTVRNMLYCDSYISGKGHLWVLY